MLLCAACFEFPASFGLIFHLFHLVLSLNLRVHWEEEVSANGMAGGGSDFGNIRWSKLKITGYIRMYNISFDIAI